MILDVVMLLVGLLLLFLAGDWIVTGAVSAALKSGISRFIASVVVVGFGTSAPEMLVAADATLKREPGLALGNIVGSNIANILLVLGLPAIFLAIRTVSPTLRRTVLITAAATVAWLAVTPTIGLSPLVGGLFIASLLAYIVANIIWPGKDDVEQLVSEDIPEKPMGWDMTVGFICMGMLGLPLGSHLAIQGSLGIAEIFKINSALVGLTIMAVGTSLPELSAAMAASFRKENDMILGNVAGSNLFNILGAGGIISLLALFSSDISLEIPGLFLKFDHWVMGGTFLVFTLYVLTRKTIGWLSGLVFVAAYAAYLYALIHFYGLGLSWSDPWI